MALYENTCVLLSAQRDERIKDYYQREAGAAVWKVRRTKALRIPTVLRE